MTLTMAEIDFLRMIKRRQDTDPAEAKLPVSDRIQNLVDRGYIRFVRLRCVMFIVSEHGIKLTEAGELVLREAELDQGADNLKEDNEDDPMSAV
jgi:hypothetical protein